MFLKLFEDRRVFNWILLALVAVLSIASITRVMTKASPNDGRDFHQLIWYPGHFVWQGDDPYAAALARKEPDLPIQYWDGVTITEAFKFRFDQGLKPTNTAPFLILVSPLARFSWPTAVTFWKFVNLGLLLFFTWALVRYLNGTLLSYQGAFVFLLLCSLIATREMIELGQTTVLNLACMICALLIVEAHPIFAGVLMGFALSKYSLTFPGFLVLLYQRRVKSMVVAVLVQLVGILAIGMIGGTPPWDVISSYLDIMMLHVNWPGYQLTSGLLRGAEPWTGVLIISASYALVAVIWRWHRSHPRIVRTQHKVFELILLVILMQHNLLVVAHRRYDHVAEILFIALVVLWVYKPVRNSAGEHRDVFLLSPRQRWLVCGATMLIAMIWILPIYALVGNLWYMRLYQVASLTATILLAWLMFKIKPATQQPSPLMHDRVADASY